MNLAFKSLRILTIFILIQSLLLASSASLFQSYAETDSSQENIPLQIEGSSAIIMEAETGQVLFGYNMDEPLPPASMSKMMTEYLVMESIKAGDISWDDMVVASKYAGNTPGSGGLVGEGHSISVKNLFRSMSIYSGNDATVALAEHIAGSEENFVKMMNDKARELGLSDEAHFVNSTGLDPEYLRNPQFGIAEYIPNIPGQTLMTAKDAALLARQIVIEHPEVLEMASQTQAHFIEEDETSEVMVNWNKMLEGWSDNPAYAPFYYEGLDGLKTGSTDQAGYCFTGTAERDGMRLITVVMNAETPNSRFYETKKLMDYGFQNFEKKTLLAAKSEISDIQSVPVRKGLASEVPVVTEQGVEFFVHRSMEDDQITIQTEVPDEELVAPIEAGQVIGTVTVTYDSPSGEMKRQVSLVAAEEVEKAGWFRLLLRSIGGFFKSIGESIKGLF